MMYQALHCDVCVKAWCRICSDDTEKFEEANITRHKGLGVDTRDGDSTHFGAPLFQRAKYKFDCIPTDSLPVYLRTCLCASLPE